ncbi:hypothetical protein JYU34_001961 [Plutella xylostella]|uniref:Uncharacterized protein n=1 Tax=Plutella xylostella TaxID=51655 RepID=A0ABQ7R572_PLUXY|nr:hypothetical protein JYU34_014626 [Plutella xylostella]KAG7310774.1 hypothetical protein JYU34_003588 [Plutella xylostella]KAG7312456.1 hypothetical protein JYU34_001961 [Plutella xylostella]
MPGRVTTHKHFLTALQTLKPKFRKALLKVCSEEEINCICECIHNVLKGNIPLQNKDSIKLRKHKSTLRKLVSKGKHQFRKHIIIQKGGAFLPIILGSVLTGLINSILR